MFKKILFSIFLIIVFSEFFLRTLGDFQPGFLIQNKWIKEVNSLELNNLYISDENGIFKVNTTVLDSIKEGNEIGAIRDDHQEIENFNLKKHIAKVSNKKNQSSFDSALVRYIEKPINKSGFYSIPFKKYNTNKVKILLLGDSFTWGHSTSNKTNSFANHLLAKGYVVYNSGISGTDVAQYQAVAEKYIPLLKPDIVILNFFMGNDISYFKRSPQPYHPVYYSTNAGNIMAFQNGVEFYSEKEAYSNAINQIKIKENDLISKIGSKTVLTTFALRALNKLNLYSISTYNVPYGKKLKMPACNEEIKKIISVCKKNNTDFELIVIPDYTYGKTNVNDFPFLFENIDYKLSPVEKEYYNMDDGHFNDEGHYEYSIFIDSLIKFKYD